MTLSAFSVSVNYYIKLNIEDEKVVRSNEMHSINTFQHGEPLLLLATGMVANKTPAVKNDCGSYW